MACASGSREETSELQKARLEIEELKAKAKTIEDQAAKAGQGEKKVMLLLQQLVMLNHQLVTLRQKEERLAAQQGAAGGCGQAGVGVGVGASAGVVAGAGTAATESEIVSLLKVIANNNKVIANNTSIMVTDQLSHKHRYTTSQATKFRDPAFKTHLVEAYQCRAERGELRCLLLNEPFDYEGVCASHLFKYSWHHDVFATLGFHNINDPKNGLLLLKPFEEAFDNGFLVFIYDDGADQFNAYWLGDDKAKIADFKTYPWKTDEQSTRPVQDAIRERFTHKGDDKQTVMESFKSVVEGRSLVFTGDHRPYKRCLSYQARKAVATAVQQGRIDPSWALGKNLEYHSPTATNIERYFQSMTEGGADNDFQSDAS